MIEEKPEATVWQARLIRYLHSKGFTINQITRLFGDQAKLVIAVLAYETQPDAGTGEFK